MFQWDKSLKSLNVPAEKLLQLFRSMRDVQLALPGIPAQEASAYLCQYQGEDKIGTLVALHLHKNAELAIYVDNPQEVFVDQADRALDQALMFVESIGFLMNDLDIQLLSASDRTLLWESLPVRKGCAPAEKNRGKAPVAAAPAAPKRAPIKSQDPFGMLADLEVPLATESAASVDDLLAAVEALRAGRPGMRPRRKVPTADELHRRRQELYTNVGRILASL